MRNVLNDITVRESILTNSRLSPVLGMEEPRPQREMKDRSQRIAHPSKDGATLGDQLEGTASLTLPPEGGKSLTEDWRLETSLPPKGGEASGLRTEMKEREKEKKTEVSLTGKSTKPKTPTPKASPKVLSNIMVAAPKAATKRQRKELARFERERTQALELANNLKGKTEEVRSGISSGKTEWEHSKSGF